MFSNPYEKNSQRSDSFLPNHGGALAAAAEHFNIPLSDWLDISTGINPQGWSVPAIPPEVWQRLPEYLPECSPKNELRDSQTLQNSSLEAIALQYYLQNTAANTNQPSSENVLSCAGSQQAIRLLPHLYQKQLSETPTRHKPGAMAHNAAKVWVTAGSFNEHAKAWEQQGHRVCQVACDRIAQLLVQQPVDVLILVNPDNPSGHNWNAEQLIKWWSILQRRGGWLIVDEAFMDTTAGQSLVPFVEREGLFVLRSVGKFFGLAGIRLGFMFAAKQSIKRADKMLGPWALSHPAQYIGKLALQDSEWIKQQQQQLVESSERLQLLLKKYLPFAVHGTRLFSTVYFDSAERLFNRLAKQGVLTRYLPATNKSQAALRFGLPANTEDNWQQLERALAQAVEKPNL